ncbi:hypothetical protein NDA11_001864 [Ustilago hordei]|uniref:Uncharacterized protein n=1 Tax=Ustilago hordei TaxID=120017 RepID=I2FM17_USTHO|nr:uncharacterized protein UHO2_04069 [Ustilago hordei]KAJ1037225.1 hypothetical protein NDA10_000750 [Ustilago hordei]KAJ1579883.1 hypothetical protein NDA15_001556 [Ustilago hordei]KAJ1581811.1 hypothetical protein NDA12_002858 [Ustilago hordei]KAJ1582373.1 hypothetical protein NDA11_001864 [Ustilago hordei]KAJ1600315.1 hypothetical protein NDA14_006065 [Ustilago hordei]
MLEIQAAREITINMDAICADLNDQLDDVSAKGGISTDLYVSNNTSQLESPQLGLYSNYTLSLPEPPSIKSSDPLALLSFMAFTMRCTVKPAMTSLGHYHDQMAFATTVMNGIALTASSQQLLVPMVSY